MTLRAQAANPIQISASVGPCFKPAGWLRSAGVAIAISLAAAPLVVSAADLLRGDPVKEGFNAPGLARIDAFFKSEVESNRTPGAVLFIARNGKLVIQKAYGHLDKSAGVPMREDALFSIASMTKVMTVVAALTLTEEARLPLSAPVSNWFPEFKEARLGVVNAQGQVTPEPLKRSLTVQDLMRHTTGLTYGARGNTPVHKLFPPSSSGAASRYTGAEFMAQMAATPLLHEPGTVWDYGFGIDTLGLVVEKESGQTLDSFMRDRIWSRLGMKDTTFHVPQADRARLAQPLPIDPLTGRAQSIGMLTNKIKFECGGGCAFSTAPDYIRFGQMLLNGGVLNGKRILSRQTVSQMTSDHLGSHIQNNVAGTEPGRMGYGFGLGVAVRKEKGVATVNGSPGDFFWNGANGTIFWVDPKERMVVVMMSAAPGEIRKIHREQLAALVYGAME